MLTILIIYSYGTACRFSEFLFSFPARIPLLCQDLSLSRWPGTTKEVVTYVHKVLTDMGYEPYYSNKGNVHVTLGGEGNPLLLAAHLDTLGAMVRSIKENGRLRPTTLGGHQ